MRTLIDVVCFNDHVAKDIWREADGKTPQCAECGSPTTRAFLPESSGHVHGDDIPGGIEIRHGLCHEDGTPQKFYSKSAMAKEAKRRNIVPYVRHVGTPGGDRSKNTQRFV